MSEPVGTPEPVSAVEDLIAEAIVAEFESRPAVYAVVVNAHGIGEVALAALSSAGYRVVQGEEQRPRTEYRWTWADGQTAVRAFAPEPVDWHDPADPDSPLVGVAKVEKRTVTRVFGPWLPVEQEGQE